ncbi:MAG: HAMP domain-containing histidine kinase [Bacteroidales bacterium]|nr:HAMP domain-containing histidine kinase [Bacteroidales bacterium]
MLLQFFFLKNAVDQNELRFHQTATSALRHVARQLIDYNNKDKNETSDAHVIVEQMSNNYYVVNVGGKINPTLLNHFLLKEFKRQGIDIDFESAIYNCDMQEMTYSFKTDNVDSTLLSGCPKTGCKTDEDFFEEHYRQFRTITPNKCTLPTWPDYTYYFGVRFTNRSKYYSRQIQTWYVINGIMLIVIVFFGYSTLLIIRQQKLSVVQKNFINNLTHEFKTPVAAIRLSAKVLADPHAAEQPERMQKYAGIVETQANRLSQQIERILQMASVEKKKIVLEKREVKLCSFIRTCIENFNNSQEPDSSRITCDFPTEEITVSADPFHLENVVFNILDNAVKYCATTPQVQVSLRRLKNAAELAFADNGIGIAPQYRRKIFGRFFRIPTGNVHNVRGFGLGLDYVKKIVERHGWTVAVTNNVPAGSIFTITIQV